jgi:hypothetical protein
MGLDNKPYCVICLAYVLYSENHPMKYFVRVQFLHKLNVNSKKNRVVQRLMYIQGKGYYVN